MKVKKSNQRIHFVGLPFICIDILRRWPQNHCEIAILRFRSYRKTFSNNHMSAFWSVGHWLVGWLFTSFVYYVNLLCSTLVLFVLIFYSLLSFCVCVYFPDAVDLINSRQQLSVSFFLNFFVSVGKISSDFS